jgi:hypothetical protein
MATAAMASDACKRKTRQVRASFIDFHRLYVFYLQVIVKFDKRANTKHIRK